MWRRVVINDVSVHPIFPNSKCQENVFLMVFLTLVDGTNRVFQNVCKELLLYVAQCPRREQISINTLVLDWSFDAVLNLLVLKPWLTTRLFNTHIHAITSVSRLSIAITCVSGKMLCAVFIHRTPPFFECHIGLITSVNKMNSVSVPVWRSGSVPWVRMLLFSKCSRCGEVCGWLIK